VTVRRTLAVVAVLILVVLAGDRLAAHESEAQQADTLDTHEIDRMLALNGGGEPAREQIRWHASRALGRPYAGRLMGGVRLPAEDATFFTWDPVLHTSPNRWWRRYGTDRLLETLLTVLGEYQDDHPDATRVGIADLSRPHGGSFGRRFGGLGHASHQNGLDVDVLYPRKDRLEREPLRPRQIDRRLAQDLVDRFVRVGAQYVFVGRRTGLRGPRRVVQAIPYHDDHMHVRLRPSAAD
jgi:murein endopeptidase